ncbi:MAG: GAF domain-containing sensor histidine kinase [Candidatus Eisenbacteria bacterium]
MERTANRSTTVGAARALAQVERVHPSGWDRAASWQVGLRWWVPPAIVVATALSRWLEFTIPAPAILLVALGILAYNTAFALILARGRSRAGSAAAASSAQSVAANGPLPATLQVACDYAAMLLLIQFTGGPGSPLLLFFVFHVIFAAILLSPRRAYLFAGMAASGVALLALAGILGWWAPDSVRFRGQAVLQPGPVPLQIALVLLFAATVFIVAALTTSIMARLRRHVAALAEATARVAESNDKLHGLYAIVGAISREPRLAPVLERIAADLARVIEAPALAVMVLSRDGQQLRIAAAQGLPLAGPAGPQHAGLTADRCPAAWRAMAERRPVLVASDDPQPAELCAPPVAAGARAALYLPLSADERIIGVLGVYGEAGQLADLDLEFLGLAGDLVAIAIENARAFEAVEKQGLEGTRFMLQVAHNLRAPLNASLSMLDVIAGGYAGSVPPDQQKYLERIGARLKRLSETIGELLSIAQVRAQGPELEAWPVEARTLALDMERTFRDAAAAKGLRLTVTVADDLPDILGDTDKLMQMLENLVSNALKYTPSGGEVNVSFAGGTDDGWLIVVTDTGIGIPESDQPRLFTEFFRASNARKLEEVGTGLGLSIVKQTVTWHGGTVRLTSTEGRGTRVTVELPREGARRDHNQNLKPPKR